MRFTCSVLASAIAFSGFASTYYVSPTGSDSNPGTEAKPFKTIGAAFTITNSGDTVTLENGVYSGPGDVDLILNETTITINSLGGAANAVIDCAGSSSHNHHFLTLTGDGAPSDPSSVTGITIKDAYTSSNGGAINLGTSFLLVSACVFTNNFGNNGGAVYSDASSGVQISNSTFQGNEASSSGGAGHFQGPLILSNCMFANNSSQYSGAIYSSGTSTLSDCSISDNTTGGGGIVENDSGAGMQIQSCAFTHNTTNGNNGTLLNYSGQMTVSDSTFIGNTDVSGGGAVSNQQGSMVVASSIFANNSAPYGGAIYNNAVLKLLGCSMTANCATSGSGGAIYADGGSNLTMADDVLWQDSAPNSAGTAEIANRGTIAVEYCDVALGYAGTGNIKVNPVFVNAAQGNYMLQNTSPCLEAGIAVAGLTTDYTTRLRHNPPTMGAYEIGSDWTVVGTAAGPNDGKRVLWVSVEGQAWLWKISSTGQVTSGKYGPSLGYQPVAVAAGPDDHSYIVWQYASGGIDVFNIGASVTSAHYSVASNYSFNSITVSADNVVHITWQSKQGQLWIWNIPPTGSITYQDYGPYN